jgi:hypothetical protein
MRSETPDINLSFKTEFDYDSDFISSRSTTLLFTSTSSSAAPSVSPSPEVSSEPEDDDVTVLYTQAGRRGAIERMIKFEPDDESWEPPPEIRATVYTTRHGVDLVVPPPERRWEAALRAEEVLPRMALDGKTYIQYSNRVTGTGLVDLLDCLDMEKIGALKWYTLEKEDDLMEWDDTRDEQKIMMALWCRWMLFSR